MAAKRFIPARNVKYAKLLPGKPGFLRDNGKLPYAAVRGLRYEREVKEYLSDLTLGDAAVELLLGPWIEFADETGKRWCQPDAVLLHRDRSLGVIVEVKYQHCEEAWWQLTQLYDPVCQALFPAVKRFGLIEVVHWYDPSTRFPREHSFTDSPLIARNTGAVNVHIYNAKRQRNVSGRHSSGKSGG